MRPNLRVMTDYWGLTTGSSPLWFRIATVVIAVVAATVVAVADLALVIAIPLVIVVVLGGQAAAALVTRSG